uniref:probable disease resistance protein At5g66900 n=1 Tax=Erigeron canadensis TaxID=72917 RepID=UPI001CB88E4B|nr:probable disease resistance protein At5g66900 [Erigeron canadensis]
MAELIGGAALGAAFGELLKVVMEQTGKTARFKSYLKRLQQTLLTIEPGFEETKKLSARLGRTEREIESYLEKAKELVLKCPRIHVWNVYKKFVYANKLIRLDDDLLRFFQIDVPLRTLNTSMRVENQVKILSQKMDRAFSIGPLPEATTRAGGFSDSCRVPGLPDLIIGMEQHLVDLKHMLLKKDTRVLVVTAPGGCGKTTLAKMLCHDKEIKDIFGENILYLTVSASSNLKIIAQKIFDHFGKTQRTFQSEEDAKNQLENLLRQVGSDQMLLVLDDVWDGSESIVQDLVFQSTGLFKILVTSRSSFPRFSKYELSLLNEKDAKTLLSYSAFPEDGIPNVPDDLVNKMVKSCKGLPLALTVVGASLRGQPRVKWEATLKKWSDGQSIMESHKHLLHRLQTSIDALDEFPDVKECFLDLGSFPEDDKIAETALLDMWVELYGLDNEGMYASENLLNLSLRNLVNLVPISKDATDMEGYCREHYVTQHDLLRELAIHLNDQKPIPERKRLFMEIHRDDFPKWWIEQTEQPVNARIISISTDEEFSSSWLELEAFDVHVLILNTRSKNYVLPPFIKKMSQLKVLIVTGYGVYPTKIGNLHFLSSLTNLRRIRFEHVSVSPSVQVIFTLPNLKKLTFVTCEIGNALKSGATEYPYMLPNLIDLEIDRCYDLKELPAELCRVVPLEKLSITNCHELDDLPKELGSISNLQTLRLHCCTKLQQLPESIGNLHKLSLIDISDCLSISALPEQIGELTGLRVLKMSGSQGLQELPASMSKLSQLEDVICNEETSYLWKSILSENSKVKINIVEEDRLENFMKICQ